MRNSRIVVVHAARRSVTAKALESRIYRPRTYKPKRGKGAKYNRAETRRRS
jgi:hypothetical protein